MESIEKIGYQEAALLLNISVDVLKQAVSRRRQVLTKLPREGKRQYLIRQQVELFKGKHLSLDALTEQERETWRTFHDAIFPPQNNQVAQPSLVALPAQLSPITIAALSKYGIKLPGASTQGSEVPQGTNFIPVLLIPTT